MAKLAAITTYFNYSKSPLVRNSYEYFARNLQKQNVDLYTVELAFEDHEFQLPDDEKIFRLRSDSILWHKEAMFNFCIRNLPKDITNIAWLDADILIHEDDWVERTNKLLERSPVVQIGNEYRFLNQDGSIHHKKNTAVKAYVDDPYLLETAGKYHVGLAWAATREFLETVGLFDLDIVGGNDSIIFASCVCPPENESFLLKFYKERVIANNCPPLWKSIKQYNKKCYSFVEGKVNYVPTNVDHIYHSDYSNRQYVVRYDYIKGFDPELDLSRDGNGMLKWTNKSFQERMKRYFLSKDSNTPLKFKPIKDVVLPIGSSPNLTLHVNFDPVDYTPLSYGMSRTEEEDESYEFLDHDMNEELRSALRFLVRNFHNLK